MESQNGLIMEANPAAEKKTGDYFVGDKGGTQNAEEF
jgi:hypothetical protein